MSNYNNTVDLVLQQLAAAINGPDKKSMTKNAILEEFRKILKSQDAEKAFRAACASAVPKTKKPKTKGKAKASDDSDEEAVPKQKNWGQLWTSKDYGCRKFFSTDFEQLAAENTELKGFAVHIALKKQLIGTSKYQEWVDFCREQNVAPDSDPPTEVTPKKLKPGAKSAKAKPKTSHEEEEVSPPVAEKAKAAKPKAATKKAAPKVVPKPAPKRPKAHTPLARTSDEADEFGDLADPLELGVLHPGEGGGDAGDLDSGLDGEHPSTTAEEF